MPLCSFPRCGRWPRRLLLVACNVDRGGEERSPAQTTIPTEPAAGTYVLGSSVTAEGAIAENAMTATFVRGGPVFLSIDVRSATIDERIKVEWVGFVT